MSEYSFVLRTVKENPGLTLAQLAALPGIAQQNDTTAIAKVLPMLVQDGRITQSGSGAGATFTSTATQ